MTDTGEPVSKEYVKFELKKFTDKDSPNRNKVFQTFLFRLISLVGAKRVVTRKER